MYFLRRSFNLSILLSNDENCFALLWWNLQKLLRICKRLAKNRLNNLLYFIPEPFQFYLFFTWLTQNLFESTKGIKSSFFTKLFLPDGKTFHLICSKHKNTLDKVINLITDSIIHLGCKLIDNIYTVNK